MIAGFRLQEQATVRSLTVHSNQKSKQTQSSAGAARIHYAEDKRTSGLRQEDCGCGCLASFCLEYSWVRQVAAAAEARNTLRIRRVVLIQTVWPTGDCQVGGWRDNSGKRNHFGILLPASDHFCAFLRILCIHKCKHTFPVYINSIHI